MCPLTVSNLNHMCTFIKLLHLSIRHLFFSAFAIELIDFLPYMLTFIYYPLKMKMIMFLHISSHFVVCDIIECDLIWDFYLIGPTRRVRLNYMNYDHLTQSILFIDAIDVVGFFLLFIYSSVSVLVLYDCVAFHIHFLVQSNCLLWFCL